MQSAHFRMSCPEGSFAAQQGDAIAARLEAAYAALAQLLGSDEADGPIEVELTDLPAAPGSADPSGAIREPYTPDAPGVNLERALVSTLLARRDAVPGPFVAEGLVTRALAATAGASSGERGRAALADARARGDLPKIEALLGGPTAATRPYYAAGRAAFATSARRLEGRWRKTIAPAARGGVLRFLRLVAPYLRAHWRRLVEIVFYLVLSVSYSIGIARMQKVLVDEALGPRDATVLAQIMAVLAVAFVIVSLGLLRQSYLVARVGQSVLRSLRLRLFDLLQRLHPAFFQTRQSGDIISRMTNDMAQVDGAVSGTLVQALRIVLLLIIACAVLISLNPRFALVALAGTPLLFVIGRYAGPARARASLRRQQDVATMTSTLQENLGVQPVVKAFGLEGRMTARFSADLDRLFGSAVWLLFLGGLTGIAASVLSIGMQLLVLGLGGWLVIGGGETVFGAWLVAGQTDGRPFTIGSLFAFLAITASVVAAVQGISGVLQGLQQASGAMDRVQELLAARPAIEDGPAARPIPRLAGELRFEDVTFAYGDQPILRGLTMAVPAGASVALVGPSGSGKSTVLNLILRFHEPREGRVTFDGLDVREATLASLRGQIGVVFQENVLLNLSVRENLRLGNLAATDEQIEAAAREAEIHEAIARMPEGYDTPVGERGGRLSGGQRQRMAIARALLRDPAILLLDEATSALDPATEAAVNATLARVGVGRTTISVTHRLAGAMYADRIYVLDRGGLAEEGTHDELLARDGLYARLWREQTGGVAHPDGRSGGVEAARLRGVPLLAELSPDVVAGLARRLTVENYAAGDVVISEGDPGERMYLVHRGQVEVLVGPESGDQRLMHVLREGDHFGEIALLRDVPRTATIRARTAAQLFSLAKRDFDAQLAAVPQLRERLEATMAERARPTRERTKEAVT